ncbi:MAG: enoyl-CoA hydratase [Acidimicrobiaceae bacterium]|nr:enoyl-CoA hydratase [Acidimicrobiaceae bacterium]
METIIVERADGVVTVTLNRPEKLNAIDTVMWGELEETFREVGNRAEDRVLVLTGAGRAFCSGADLTGMSRSDGHALIGMRRVGDTILALHHVAKPTIAKVNGVAAGAGCNLGLGCDLVVASDEARFSEIFARRGLTIDAGGSWLLPRLVGLHRAKELALLADILSAEEAAAMGLVNRVVPASELDAFVADWAARLAAGPPLALSMTKTLLNAGLATSMTQAVEAEAQAQSVNEGTEDAREAMMAFREKRDPVFKGC